jgi:L-seryl-tRNA(Ser) seleniumtransferase
MNASSRRDIPALDKFLVALGETPLPRPTVVATIRDELTTIRKQPTIPGFSQVLERIRDKLRGLARARIQSVINGTGILIHTNLGRAPLGPAVIETLSRIGSNYNNLEYDLSQGGRGCRAAYLEYNLALLCRAEAATVVNNNAAALVLILRHFCKPRALGQDHDRIRTRQVSQQNSEVIISRGELVQIGGGFRIPQILEASGARLVEVGTTNNTTIADYAEAITKHTVLILKVHRSNFCMNGFVASPATKEIAALAHKRRVPFVEDLGSGAMIQTHTIAGLEHEPTPAEVFCRGGLDLICFSGDKLFGGPQAGIIAGRAKLVAALKREPLFRALRCDKLILSALETIVDGYLRSAAAPPYRTEVTMDSCASDRAASPWSDVPVLAMMFASDDDLRIRARRITEALTGLSVTASIGTGHAAVGGGALPRSTMTSVTLDLRHDALTPEEIGTRLREHTMPVIGYIARGIFKIDLRTVFPSQDEDLILAIQALSKPQNEQSLRLLPEADSLLV